MIKKVSFNAIIVIIFCLALGAGIFYVHNLKNNQQTPRAYLPADTRWYAEFDLKNNPWHNLNEEEKKFFYQQKIVPEIEEKFWPLIDMVATINTPEGVVWLLETKNSKQLLIELSKNFKSALLEPRLIGLAKQKKSLELIKNNTNFPLSTATKLITNNFLSNITLNLYFSAYQAPKINDFLPFEIGEQKNNIFLSLNKKDDCWQYELNTVVDEKINDSKFDSQFKNWPSEENKIIKNIWQADGALLVAVPNLAQFWPSENIIRDEFKKIFNNNYLNITTNKFDKNIISGAALIWLEKKPTAKDNNWLLVTQVNDLKEKITPIKELASILLAYTYPEEQVKKLPDGSTAINLVANNKKYSFQTSTNKLYELVDTPAGAWALASSGDYLMLTNKASLLDKILILEKTNQNPTALEQEQCFFAEGQEFIKIKLSELELKLPGQFLSANIENNNGQLKIKGCLK